MNPRLTLLLFASSSIVCSFAGCQPIAKPNQSAKATAANSLDRVSVGPPTKKTLQLFTEQPGRVEPFEETPILSKLPGYVGSVHTDIGDRVAKGQVLIRIAAPEYQDQLEQQKSLLGQAEAEIKQAEAALAAAEAAANSAKAMVAQADAGVDRTQAEYARWESEHLRMQQLVSKGSVTPKLADEVFSQFHAAQATKKEALASIESAKARHSESQAHVLTAQADIDAAKAKRSVAQAAVTHAETMLEYIELKSPFDGLVVGRNVDAGHYVQPAGSSSSQPLMKVANVNQVRVCVGIPESEAYFLNAGFDDPMAGDLATIFAPSLPRGNIEARVTRTSFQLDSQSRTLAAQIDINNAELKLMPGAFVTVKILLEQRENTLSLPITAIVRKGAETYCCVVTDSKIEQRLIELGLRVGDEVEIKSGLAGSETIVLLRAGSLAPGQVVEVLAKKS